MTLWWEFEPNQKPVTERTFAISDVSISRQATLGEYASRRFLRTLLGQAWNFPEQGDPRNDVVGTTVDFNVALKGFPREDIAFRWTLFDAITRHAAAESEEIDPLCLYHPSSTSQATLVFPCVRYRAVFRDSDISSFAFWINTTNESSKCFFVRIEGFSKRGRVTFEDSPNFPPPSAVDANAGCPAAAGGGATGS